MRSITHFLSNSLLTQVVNSLSDVDSTVLSLSCLKTQIDNSSDDGQTNKAFQIKSELETASATPISLTYIYQSVKNNWQ